MNLGLHQVLPALVLCESMCPPLLATHVTQSSLHKDRQHLNMYSANDLLTFLCLRNWRNHLLVKHSPDIIDGVIFLRKENQIFRSLVFKYICAAVLLLNNHRQILELRERIIGIFAETIFDINL